MAEVLDKRRAVFISASFLSKQYRSIPVGTLNNSVFFFGAKRSWLFPSTREEMIEARSQSTKYLEFDEDFKSLILLKEGEGLCFWQKPHTNFKAASAFFEKIVDPVSGENYLPLVLDDNWWRQEFDTKEAKFTSNVDNIIANYKSGEHDYDSVMELIFQSNPTLVPTLYWASEAEEKA